MPTGTRRVTGWATAPAMVRYFSVTGCVGRQRDVQRGLDVDHDRADGQGDAAGRNDPAQDVVDQDELVAGRVGVSQRGDLDGGGDQGLRAGR